MKAGRLHPIARELRAARHYADMSRAQVATAVGISPDALGDWERGEFEIGRGPAAGMLREIARITGVPEAFKHVAPDRSQPE